MIKCVMFDFGNVLIHFDTPRFYEYVNKYKTTDCRPEELFTGKYSQITIDYDLGKIDSRQFFNYVRKTFGLNSVRPENFFGLFGDIMEPDLEMLEIKKALIKQKVPLVLISNINRFHLKYAQTHYPAVFDDFHYKVLSCLVGVRKPDPEMWIWPMDFLGLKAEECLFIDDYLANIEAFRKLGGRGYYYNVTDTTFSHNGNLARERNILRTTLKVLGLIG